MKPIQTLLFLVSVGILSLALAWFTPKNGFQITDDFTVYFASFESDTTQVEPIEKIEDVEQFLEELDIEIDSTAIKDSIRLAELKRRQELSRIQWNNHDRSSLDALFTSLEEVKAKKTKARIMHYGDSQIEGDRITSVIRNEIQKEYGGLGPGLLPIVEGVQNASMIQTNSDNWNRYTLFGRVDTNVTHRRYGPLCSFGSFTPIDGTNDSTLQSAQIKFQQSGMTYWHTRQYNQIKLYYGHATDTFTVAAHAGGELLDSNVYLPTNSFQTISWNVATAPKNFDLSFSSKISPEFYAISFEGNYGVTVDNIGLRGSSGTLFKKLDSYQLKEFMQSEPIRMIILQYGGNTVPYIKSEEKAIGYGKWFSSQIKYLKKINPNAAFVVIGPSDMSTKVNGEFTTFPYLEIVRDVLKKAAFDNNAGYWDLYEVMGGKNSMISWVEAETPLAGKDYIHFNNRGTKKVSELFMKAFWYERDLWLNDTLTKPSDTINVE